MEKERLILGSGFGKGSGIGEAHGFPEAEILVFWEETVRRLQRGAQPAEDPEEVGFCHHGAPEAGAVRSAAEVEEDGAASSWKRRVGVVADFNEPSVGGVTETHALFFEPCGGSCTDREAHMAVVFWKRGVVDPCIVFSDAQKRIIGIRRKPGVGGIDGT
jgi:hypothetical protein